jgi:hypothetical protein
MKTCTQLLLSFIFISGLCFAQKNEVTHLNLGFNAKIKKSIRTLSEILANSKKKDVDTAYHLIAGCFSSLINAERLVNQLINDSHTASVVGKEDDLYFVAFKSYQAYNDALKCLAEFKTKGIDSWVKKM